MCARYDICSHGHVVAADAIDLLFAIVPDQISSEKKDIPATQSTIQKVLCKLALSLAMTYSTRSITPRARN